MEEKRQKKLLRKWALVTEGSRGIGSAICKELAKKGANIIVNYIRDKESVGNIVNGLREYGVNAYAMKAEISDRDMAPEMVDEAISKNPIDILVSNAAIVEWQPFLDITLESWAQNKIE